MEESQHKVEELKATAAVAAQRTADELHEDLCTYGVYDVYNL